jgi:integrase/recombinase XerD
LSREEIRRLEDAAGNERDALVVRLLADTAIRNDELVKLRLQDVLDHDRKHFLKVQGKGARDRMVPLEAKLYRRLRRYAERQRPADAASNRLFVSRRRDRRSGDYEPLTASGIQQLIRELGQKAVIRKRVHPHLFRHSALTWMLQQGMDSLTVARIASHSSLVMIQRVYSHLTPADDYAALMQVLRTDS